MTSSKYSTALLPVAVATALLLAACSGSGEHARLYHTAPHAPSLAEQDLRALEHMGPKLVDRGVNFAVYSEHAERIDVLLFDDPESDRPTRRFPLHRMGDVWSLYVEGVGVGQHYGYVAWGPNWPYDPEWYPGSVIGFLADVDAGGHRYNPNKLLIDPYGVAVHRDHDWSRASVASGPGRAESTWGAGAKSVVVRSEYQWGPAEDAWRERRRDPAFEDHRWQDLVIYEVHPKGFTASAASGVSRPGTYRGIGEMAPYLADLGINAVELLPVHEKPLDGGYWGYNNISFFAVEVDYAAEPDPLRIVDEFKWMVEQLHAHGVELIVDVVYNHTGEGGLWREKLQFDDFDYDSFAAGADDLVNFDPKEVAGLYSFRGLDNVAYYALSEDRQGYWNNTGVGNQTRPNHRPMRRLILDSLRYMATELHVDGFRFDLGPILGERDMDYNNWDDPANTVLQDIIDDPVLLAQNVRIIAEPWSAGGNYGGVKIGEFPASTEDPAVGWYEWNARFRDWWRAFVNFDDWKLSSLEADADGGFTMTGFDRYYRSEGRRPYHTVNFITVHDGFTMYDAVSYDHKQNKCSPLNPVCCEEPLSVWCDRQSGEEHNRSRNWGSDAAGEAMKRQLMRNLFLSMLISHGTPLLLGGDEWMRTQLGNNNAYYTGADNAFNWHDWGAWKASPEKTRMHDFVRQMIRFRREHRYAVAPADYGAGAPFAWKSAQNGDDVDWGSRHVMVHYYDPEPGPELLFLINMERHDVTFTLPFGREWHRVVDTQQHFDGAEYIASEGLDDGASHNAHLDAPVFLSDEYTAKGSTIVILEAATE